LVTWYPLSKKTNLPNGNYNDGNYSINYIEGRVIYELNIDKLISAETNGNISWIKYNLLYNNSNYYQKEKPIKKLTFFYTQNKIPMLNSINFTIEDDKYIINNNY
jgi:hypothetical protein